ncbi:MAG TPA: HAMP domain-containing sensor histidine kinase [Candidatus Limnocylindria bacterium]|nr:HAMP domain-containing sensor histidine kinase [Candidatus Limnocylindria bacterium]
MLWLHDGFENRPPFVAICVRDSGPGIPLESLPGLFVRGTTNKPEGQGTGLGMGIVRQCLQMVGGAISVETQPGKGSSFVVYLPAAQRT